MLFQEAANGEKNELLFYEWKYDLNAFVAPNVTASHMENQGNKNRVGNREEFFGEKIEANCKSSSSVLNTSRRLKVSTIILFMLINSCLITEVG